MPIVCEDPIYNFPADSDNGISSRQLLDESHFQSDFEYNINSSLKNTEDETYNSSINLDKEISSKQLLDGCHFQMPTEYDSNSSLQITEGDLEPDKSIILSNTKSTSGNIEECSFGAVDLHKSNGTTIKEPVTDKKSSETVITDTPKSVRKKKDKFLANAHSNALLNIDESGRLNLLEHNLNKPGSPLIKANTQFVPRATKNKRESKIHCCYYCKRLIVDQIRRHIVTVHANEKTIVDASRCGKEQKHVIITDLINLGDYYYNNSSMSEGKEKIVARKLNSRKVIKPKEDPDTKALKWPIDTINSNHVMYSSENGNKLVYDYDLPTQESGEKFVPCKGCFKTFKKSTIRRHKCPRFERFNNSRGILAESHNLIPDIHPAANLRLRSLVLKTMQNGDIRDVIKCDEILILFANDMIMYYTKDQNYSWISHQLRLFGQLLLLVRKEQNKVKEFRDILDNRYVTSVSNALQEMSDVDEVSGKISKGNKCREMSTLLKKVIDFYIRYCTERDLDQKIGRVRKFETLLNGKFKLLNKQSRDCLLEQAKVKAPKKIPKIADIMKLCSYTEEVRSNAMEVLKKGFDYHQWKKLNESTLLALQLFNRKRQGEISRLLLIDLNESSIYQLDDVCTGDEFTKMSAAAREGAKDYVRVAITNKKGLKNVGLLIHKSLFRSINLILSFRNEAKIKPTNKYVFAKRSYNDDRDSYFIACNIMRIYSKLCGVKDHETLRGAELRKQLATMMYSVENGGLECADLAGFMGHDYEIHKAYYKQKVPLRELLTLPPLLEQAQGINIRESSSEAKGEDQLKISKVLESSSEFQRDTQLETLSIQKSMSESDSSFHPTSAEVSLQENASESSDEPNYFKEIKKEKIIKKGKKRKRVNSDDVDDNPKVKKAKRVPWSNEEKMAIKNFMDEHGMPRIVSTQFINTLKKQYIVLESREVLVLRSYIHNNHFTKID